MPKTLAAVSTCAVLLLCLTSAAPAAAKPPTGEEMQYGPVVCHSVTFVKPPNHNAPTWAGAVTRAINVKLPHDGTVCYDADRLAVAGIWRGGFLDVSKTHHTSYKGNTCPRPGATPLYEELKATGWATPKGELENDQLRLTGYYLHGDDVLLSYSVAGRNVLELPGAKKDFLKRDIEIAGGKQAVSMLIGVLQGDAAIEGKQAQVDAGKQALAARVSGKTDSLEFRYADGRLYLDIPASNSKQRFRVHYHVGNTEQVEQFLTAAKLDGELVELSQLKNGGPRRWQETITTKGKLGDNDQAYTVDDLPVPERPYGSWMRIASHDFFPDGRLAVATMPGDVWIVSWDGDDISKLTWQRFATGLYEPLGLKIVDGKIYVRGRDRITRLHDLNDDGEADHYENFHSHGLIGPGYHAFIFDLNTDAEGNFWYVISGRKAPSIGEVIKLSPDGKKHEVIATHFRHPNGMGVGGPHGWVTIADNPDGKYPSGGCIVRAGKTYGHNGPRTEPFLYLLPPKVDTSSGSQCWADPKRWGPLSGSLVHTSYSTSSITYVLTQNSKPHASGFAVHMPFGFKAGVMRARVSPRDGQMYISGQRGWDSNAAADGCLARVRYTGADAYVVTGAKATKEGVELKFACPLDPKTVDYDNFFAARTDGKKEDEIDIDDVEMIDERTALVRFEAEDIDPSKIIDREATKRAAKQGDDRTHYRVGTPLAITFSMKAKDGTPVKDTVYCTINGF